MFRPDIAPGSGPDVAGPAERLTLGVLLCGVAALALSDFVSPVYWLLASGASLARLLCGPRLALTETQASALGWGGFFWVGAELVLGRAWLVAFTDFLLILSLAVSVEAPTPRNHLHRLITGLFLILAGSVLTDSVLYALPLAAFLLLMWRACRALYGMGLGPGGNDMPAGGWGADWRAFGWMLAVTAALFVLAPRGGGHETLRNVQPRMQVSGFSGQVALGDFARRLDPAVVMRVEAPDMSPDQARRMLAGRYWRGVALSRYRRGRWQPLPSRARRMAAGATLAWPDGGGARVWLYREAASHTWIMLPDGLSQMGALPSAARLDDNGGLAFLRPPPRRLRLAMWLAGRGQRLHLRPPVAEERRASESTAIAAWARRMAAGASTPGEQLARLASELRGWRYDLHAPIDAAHPVATFLTRTRRGHCELYASALALAARSLGVPARVVNGYYGGEWNEVGHFLLIRQQHAHAWVEAWVDGRWQRFDPTPPSRWELSGVRFASLDQWWESVRLAWYRHVLEFSGDDRTRLARMAWRWLSFAWPWLAAAAFLLLLAWQGVRVRRRGVGGEPWAVLDAWLARRGVNRPPFLPLRRLPPPDGVPEGRWRVFVRAWEAQVYADVPRWSRRELRRRLRALLRTA